MTTIRDIARKAGVSVATVSRVMNGYAGVNEATKEKVLKVTRELSYRPNAVARSLVTRRSWSFGVFYLDPVNSDLRHPFFQDVLDGFKRRVGQEGYDLLVFNNQRPADAGLSFTQRCYEQQVDGVLVVGVPKINPDLTELANSGIPCMGVDCDLVGPKASHVSSDNVDGAIRAMKHLLSLGHRKIALLNGSVDVGVAQERLKGYRLALEEAGLPYRPDWVHHGDFTRETGETFTFSLLDSPDRPTAIFCTGGDMMAIGALSALAQRGVQVPQEMSVVGFDDIAAASFVTPSLTTVRQDAAAMGLHAAEALLSMMNPEASAPPALLFPTQLIIRKSTAAPLT